MARQAARDRHAFLSRSYWVLLSWKAALPSGGWKTNISVTVQLPCWGGGVETWKN